MEKIIFEIEGHNTPHVEYQALSQRVVKIGRAFDNDIIINDPFVSAHHLVITMDEMSWECEDVSSLNGTLINGHKVSGKALLISGNSITIGKTTIMIWSSTHPIVATLPLDHTSKSKGMHVLVTIGCFFVFYYLLFSNLYPKIKVPISFALLMEMLFFGGITLWSGVWALVTRFTKRQHRFYEHLSFACNWFIINTVIFLLFTYVGFYICNDTISNFIEFPMLMVLVTIILNGHLKLATNMSQARRLLISSLVALALMGLAGAAFYFKLSNFDPKPEHSFSLVPMPKTLIPTIPVTQEIKRLENIF